MTPITYHLTLDLKRDLHQVLVMKEGDANTRTVNITITDNGEKFTITDQRITLKWKKPDHYKVQNDCTKVDTSTVSFHCTDQMLAAPGIAKAELCMFDKTGHLLSTMPFQVSIKPAAVTDSDVASSNEFKTLLKLFDEFKTEHDRIKAEVLKDKKAAEDARDLSKSYAHGNTGKRNGENTDNSKYYKEQAGISSNNAKTHADNSRSSANASASSASAAASSASAAAASKTLAEQQASNASSSAATASTKALESSNSASLSKSYAMGGTGNRTDEDTDNSKYYYQQSKSIYDDFAKAEAAGIVSTGYLQEHFVADHVSSARGNVTAKGWYRIAKAVGNHNENSCVISIKRGYNLPAPEYQKVQFLTSWTYKKFVSLAAYSRAHIWTQIRHTHDSASSTEYIEIYQDRDTYANSWLITIEDALSAYSNEKSWTAITPVLTSETVSGVTVNASLNLPSYFDLDFLLRTGGGELTGAVGLKGAGRFTYHADASTEYARGFEYRNSSGAMVGGIGAHGKNGEFSKIYLGIGSSNPFTDSAGLTIRSNSIQWKSSNVVTENSGAASRVSDAGNKTAISFQYSGSGLNSSSWIAAWDGYKIGAIAPGKISGVASATKATQDGNGNVISSTYAKQSQFNSDRLALGGNAKSNTYYCTALGGYAVADTPYATALGYTANARGGNFAMAVGYNASANGTMCTASGSYANASGPNTSAFGARACASSYNSIALGYYANAYGYNSTALGTNAYAKSTEDTALGHNAKATGSTCVALGAGANASADSSMALGVDAKTSANHTIALGISAKTSNTNSVALGYFANVSGTNAIAIGVNAKATSYGTTSLGGYTNAGANYATSLGMYAGANGIYSTALGYSSSANSYGSTALGYAAYTSNSYSIQLGNASSLSSITARVSITVTSDERDKADITEMDSKALDFLKKVKAIRYVFNSRELYIDEEHLSEEDRQKKEKYGLCSYNREEHALGTKKGNRIRAGVSAQNVLEALNEIYGTSSYANLVNDNLFDISQDEIPEDVENQLAVNYEGFIPFLIKAVQELAKRLESLESENRRTQP